MLARAMVCVSVLIFAMVPNDVKLQAIVIFRTAMAPGLKLAWGTAFAFVAFGLPSENDHDQCNDCEYDDSYWTPR
jgi:hypothetical protein